MPLYIPPISRRRFLLTGAATTAGVMMADWSSPLLATDSQADPRRFALLSDPHISAKPEEIHSGVHMTDNLRHVVDEVLALPQKPAAVLLNGDSAFQHGLREDYRQVTTLLDPLRKAGLPLWLTMGNHDDRDTFAAELTKYNSEHPPIDGRFVLVAPTEAANWFTLDSLRKTNDTPGELGAKQLEWLAKALDAHADKPAIVVCHHNPNPADGKKGPIGLVDTPALLDTLTPRKQVKALIYGHTHNWSVGKHDYIHWINLPPTGYVFDAKRPSGWVLADLRDDGMKIELSALDKKHAEHGQKFDLKWRAG